jgi:anthranilate synthase component I
MNIDVPAISSTVFIRQCLTDVATPLQLFHTLSQNTTHAVLLESTDADTRLARFSFIALHPAMTFTVKNGRAELVFPETGEIKKDTCTHPWTTLRDLKQAWLAQHGLAETDFLYALKDVPALGGWFGITGYNAVQYKEQVPQQTEDPLNVPDVAFGFYPCILVFDHLSRVFSLVSIHPDTAVNEHAWQQVQQAIQHPLPLPPLSVPHLPTLSEQAFEGVTSNMGKPAFLKKVSECKDLIQAGEVFQIVLAQRFTTPYTDDVLRVYRALIATNPSPYAYVLKFPGYCYVGSSPETFVDATEESVILRALAGTRKRGSTPEADARLAIELRENEKELAEHRMLVDLARNDLGRLCEVSSVRVGELAQVHYYTHVMHLATEIQGKRIPAHDEYSIFAGVLPRGTMSGAPKIRAMQHLARMEPDVRGFYSGAVGYIDVAGNLKSCIAIRSALLKDGLAHVQAGAGIVNDSDPEDEHLETLNKSRSILTAIAWAKKG